MMTADATMMFVCSGLALSGYILLRRDALKGMRAAYNAGFSDARDTIASRLHGGHYCPTDAHRSDGCYCHKIADLVCELHPPAT